MSKQIYSMNGAMVIARDQDNIWIRIPGTLAQPIDGGCACDFCKANPSLIPKWDAIVVSITAPKNSNDYVSTVHIPDVAGFRSRVVRRQELQRVDFTVNNQGTIFILTGITDSCKAWIEEHVGNDETQAWGKDGIVVEHRYIQDIVNGLQAEGFVGANA